MNTLHYPEKKDVYIMEQFIALGIRCSQLSQLNKYTKGEEAIFLSDTTTANRRSIKSNCNTDWHNSHVDLGRHHSKHQYGKEYQIKENWIEWENGLSRLTVPNSSLLQPLGSWIAPSSQTWRYYFNATDKELWVIRGDTIDVYLPTETEGQTSDRCYKQLTITYKELPGEPATVT